MTLLDQILEDATSSQVPVADLLRRISVLGARLKNEPLAAWARSELSGYKRTDQLPTYRTIGMGQLPVYGEFVSHAGILSRVPLAPSALPEGLEQIRDELFSIYLLQGAAEYETLLATGRPEFPVPWRADEVQLLQRVWPGLSSAFRALPANAIAGMLDQIRNRVLDFALQIQAEDPSAGDAVAGTESTIPPSVVMNIYDSTIGAVAVAGRDASIANVRLDLSAVWPDVSRELSALGVPDDEVTELREAMELDGPVNSEVGPRTSQWIARLATRAATGAVTLASNDALQEVVHHIMHALGLG